MIQKRECKAETVHEDLLEGSHTAYLETLTTVNKK